MLHIQFCSKFRHNLLKLSLMFCNKISFMLHFRDMIKNPTCFAFFAHLQGMTKYRKGGVYIVRHILETFEWWNFDYERCLQFSLMTLALQKSFPKVPQQLKRRNLWPLLSGQVQHFQLAERQQRLQQRQLPRLLKQLQLREL